MRVKVVYSVYSQNQYLMILECCDLRGCHQYLSISATARITRNKSSETSKFYKTSSLSRQN